LCILDGYDEVAESIPRQLEDAFKQLLASPKLLVTSRPEAVASLRLALSKPLPPLLPLDAQIELTGFSDDSVKNYIEKFFSAYYTQVAATKNANELLAFLKANPALSELARIPILLEILCCIWPDPATQLSKVATATQLYQQALYGLMRHYLVHKQRMRGVEKWFEEQLEVTCNKELMLLEWLAFHAFSQSTNPTVIHGQLLKKGLTEFYGAPSEKTLELWNTEREKAVALGLLRDISGSQLMRQGQEHCRYEFIHLSFQEFFVARFLWRALQDPKHQGYQQAVEWIRNYKYKPSGQRTLSFLAGLLSANKDATNFPLTAFWQVLEDEPRDWVGLNHLCLITCCLQEASCDLRVPQQAAMVEQIAQALEALLYAPQSYNFIVELLEVNWLSVLQQSPMLVRHPILEARLVKGLQDTKLVAGGKCFHVFNCLGAAAVTPQVLTVLEGLLRDGDSSVKSSCATALSGLGTAAATAEVLAALPASLLQGTDDVRRSSAIALSNFGVTAATPKVLTALVISLQEDKDSDVRGFCATALGHFGTIATKDIAAKDKMLTALVTRLAKDRNSFVRRSCATALGNLGAAAATPEVLTALVASLQENIVDVTERFIYLGALRNLGIAAMKKPVLKALVAGFLQSENSTVRNFCALALDNLGAVVASSERLTVLVTSLQEDKDSDVRGFYATALGNLEAAAITPEVLTALVTRLEKDKNNFVRKSCATALGNLGATAATPKC
jgi:HEAT repeat protein